MCLVKPGRFILLIDVDNFKLYNDTYGHVAGDLVLKKVAKSLEASSMRPADLGARFGGEEFAIILPATGINGAIISGKKVCAAVEAMRIPHAHAASGEWLTVSIGVATLIPQAEQSPNDLIELADRRLYRAKEQGKHRVVSDDE